jgi:hypothetical protein
MGQKLGRKPSLSEDQRKHARDCLAVHQTAFIRESEPTNQQAPVINLFEVAGLIDLMV